MSDDDAIFVAAIASTNEAWVCMPEVRYVRRQLHLMELQQAWREYFTGRIEWRPVPIVEDGA